MYVTVAAFVGFYSFGWTSRFALRNNGSSIRRIIINSYFALLISSSLPLVTRTLSLISFDLMGYFKVGRLTFPAVFHLQMQYLRFIPTSHYPIGHWIHEKRIPSNSI
jgi:hypothetical protein